MDQFKTTIFPDSGLINNTFLNSCLIYADKVVLSPYQSDELTVEEINRMRKFAKLHGLDWETGIKNYEQVNVVRQKIKLLEEHGVVERWVPDEDIFGFNESGDLHQNLTNRVLRKRKEFDWFFSSLSEKIYWENEGLHVKSENSEFKESEFPFYVLRAVQRILAAQRCGFQITASDLIHHKVISQIQMLALTRPELISRVGISDIIRFSVPKLIARDLEDVLIIRDELNDYLQPFRIELTRLVSNIPDYVSTEEYPHELRKIVDGEIQPQITELRRYLENPGRVLKNHLVSTFMGTATASITIIGSMISGVDIEIASLFSPIVHLLGAKILTNREIQNVKFSNPFTFAVLAEDKT